jgi:hypothetical protein
VEVVSEAMTMYFVLLIAALAWGTFVFGAVYAWAYWPLAAACLGLGAWGVVQARDALTGQLRKLVWALVAVGCAIGLQLVPVPLAVFRALSPHGDQFLSQFNLAYGVDPPAWRALSITPSGTETTLALFCVFAVFLLGTTAVMGRLSVRRVGMALLGLGLGVVVVGLVDRGPRIEHQLHFVMYGFWKPEQDGHPFTPFVDPNHYAGWMVMVVGVTLGYLCGLIEASWVACRGQLHRWLRWVSTPDAGRPVLLALSLPAMVAALVMTNSRSGFAALGITVACCAIRGLTRARDMRVRVTIVAVLGAVFLGAILWAGVDPLVQKFSAVSTDPSGQARTGAWRDAIRIFRDFPIFGSGMNSFGTMMLYYQSGARESYFTQAHNDYLQILAEGGLLVAGAALALIGVVANITRRRFQDDADVETNWIRFGAVAGIAGIASQSALEFPLQMPGVAAIFVVLLAICVHRPSPMTTHASRL